VIRVSEKPFDKDGKIPAPRVVYVNTTQIMLTRDRLGECLRDAMDCNSKRDRWLIPLGILVPIVATLATTSFTRRFGIDGGDLQGVFASAGLFDLGWLLYALIRRGRRRTVDSMIEDLTKDAAQVEIAVRRVGEEPAADKAPGNVQRSSWLTVIAHAGRWFFQSKIRQPGQSAQIDLLLVVAAGRRHAWLRWAWTRPGGAAWVEGLCA
jgi:hypothetical protein